MNAGGRGCVQRFKGERPPRVQQESGTRWPRSPQNFKTGGQHSEGWERSSLPLGWDLHKRLGWGEGWEDPAVGWGVQAAIIRRFSQPVTSGFSKEVLYWCLQVLGPQRREHEVDLSGPHPGCHRGKNPAAESPHPFGGKGIGGDPEPFACGHWGCAPSHPGTQGGPMSRGIQEHWSLPAFTTASPPRPSCGSPRTACPPPGGCAGRTKGNKTTVGVCWQVNFFLFLNIVRVLVSKLWGTNTGKLDPRQQYRQVWAPADHALALGWRFFCLFSQDAPQRVGNEEQRHGVAAGVREGGKTAKEGGRTRQPARPAARFGWSSRLGSGSPARSLL